ncbi:MAG: trypsin-like peptidase domain-containing protein [Planctomycetota bacterium]
MKRTAPLCLACVLLGAFAGRHLLTDDGVTPSALAQSTVIPSPYLTADAASGQALGPAPATPEEETNIRVYQIANPSVVNINTRTTQIVDNFFRIARQAEGSGSGAVIDRQGHIVTNFHVVEDAEAIEVTMGDESFPAQVVGVDKEQDVAVLRIDAPPDRLVPITVGTSSNLRVGQRAYVLGNPFGLEGTLTTGIISSLNRNLPSRVEDFEMRSIIQTDAAMNPGNSGGPLLDTAGRMIGMCVAIATRSGDSAGIGFAIPVDRIKNMLPDLIEHGRVVRASLGIVDVVQTAEGLVLRRLVPGGPADEAGLRGFRVIKQRVQRGGVIYELPPKVDRSYADRILSVDGQPMRSGVQFRDKILECEPGDTVSLTILREGREMEVQVRLGTE